MSTLCNPIEICVLQNNEIFVSRAVVSDSVLYERMKFTFPESWDGYTKTAVFRNGDTVLSIILNSDSDLCVGADECYIPHEVIKFPEFTVSVFGILGDSRVTSSQAAIRVIQSGYGEGDEPSDPTPSEYEQLVNLANETKEIAQSVRTDADNGVFKGDPFTYSDFTPEQLASLKGKDGADGKDGTNGTDGYTPQKGVDYFTPDDIASLNIPSVDQTYTPDSENAQSGKAVAKAVEPKLDKPSMPPTVGNVLKVLSLNEDGTFTCEWSDAPSGGAVDDVQINGASIVADGVANIPTIGKEQYGVAKFTGDNGLFGINYNKNAGLYIVKAENSNITNRANDSRPITSTNLDYAVKSAMCDGKGAAWTADEQAAARERIGLRNLELISELTVAEDVEMFSMAGLDLNRILIDIELSDIPSNGVTTQIYIQTPVNNLIYIGRIAQASGNRRIIINAEYIKPFIVVNSIFSNTPTNANSTVNSSPPIYCENNIKGFMLTFDLYAGSKIKVFGVRA